jgi:hypothetical protein
MESKPFWQSLTLLGAAILTICSIILPAVGQANIAEILKQENQTFMDLFAGIGSVIGLILTIVGRFRATKTLNVGSTAVVLPLIFIVGCMSNSDRLNYVKLSNSVAGSIEAVTALNRAGKLTQEQIKEVDLSIDLATIYLGEYRAALDANEPVSVVTIDRLQNVLDRLIEIQLSKEK